MCIMPAAFRLKFTGVTAVSILAAFPLLVSCGTTSGSARLDTYQPTVRDVAPAVAEEAPSARDTDLVDRLHAISQDRDYSVATLFAQNHGETLNQARGYQHDVKISYLQDIDVKIKGETGEFDASEIRGDLKWDLPVDPDSWMTLGVHSAFRDLDFTPSVVGADDDELLHEIGAVIGGGHFINPGTFVEVSFEPGVYSDLGGSLKSDDWQFYGHVRAAFRNDEYLFWRVGLRHDNLFEDIDVYPELGVAWQISDQWRLDVLLPHHIEAMWNPSAELVLQAGVELTGNEYEVRSPSAVGGRGFTWEARELRVYGGATWRFSDQVATFGRIGSTVGGDYEFNGNAGRTDGTPEGSFFFEVGTAFNW